MISVFSILQVAALRLAARVVLQVLHVPDGHLDDFRLLDSASTLLQVGGGDEATEVCQAVVHPVSASFLNDPVGHWVLVCTPLSLHGKLLLFKLRLSLFLLLKKAGKVVWELALSSHHALHLQIDIRDAWVSLPLLCSPTPLFLIIVWSLLHCCLAAASLFSNSPLSLFCPLPKTQKLHWFANFLQHPVAKCPCLYSV